VWSGGGTVETENRIDTDLTESYDTLASELAGRELLEPVLFLYVGADRCRRGWFAVVLADNARVLKLAQIWKWSKLLQ
jgi:hypothetical protein